MTLAEVKDEKLTCVVHTKSKAEAKMLTEYMQWENWDGHPLDHWNEYAEQTGYYIEDGELSQFSPVRFYKAQYPNYGEVYEFSDLFPVGSIMMGGDCAYKHTESGIEKYKITATPPRYADGGVVSIHDLPTSEWYNPMRLSFKNGSSIEALPNTSDVIRSTSDFSTGFKGGNTPTSLKMEVVKDRTKTMKDWVDSLTDAWAKLGCTTFRVSPSEVDELIKKEFNVKWIEEEKKMPTKFTFYVTEGYRIDKSNNTRIPTMTTEVLINGKDYQYSGSATCDKTDYEEREGVLNAIANAVCGGNFDREFNKVMKNKAFANKKSRTCTYCGQVFDTVEEKQEHEAWHVECKKARRERYLLRKRAKEIAFEEQAQKMAKEMMGEQK